MSKSPEHPVRTSFLVFASVAALLILPLFTPLGVEINSWANHQVARTNALLLHWLGADGSVAGTYIHTPSFSVRIVDRCNGLIATALLVATCASLPVRSSQRLAGCCGALVLVTVFNQLRLVIEMLYGSLYPESYQFMEEVVVRSVLAALTLGVFCAWAAFVTRRGAST